MNNNYNNYNNYKNYNNFNNFINLIPFTNNIINDVINNDDNIKKKRKPRVVKGGYIDLDDVTEEPGDSFSNWIRSAKTKLRMREMKLMQMRIVEIKTIIFENIKIFENDTYTGNNQNLSISERNISELVNNQLDSIVLSTMNELNKELETWTGIQLNQTSKDLSSFRIYFSISRNWFDQKKKRIKANHFWIEILNVMQQFAQRVSKNYVWNIHNDEIQCKYYHNLFQQIMYGIFKSEITFAATKPQPLLPSGMIKDIKNIKKFILQYFGEYLDINKILTVPKGKRKLNAAKVRKILIERLKDLLQISKQQFHESLDLYYNHNNNNNSENNNYIPISDTNYYNNINSDSLIMFPNENAININNINNDNFSNNINHIHYVVPSPIADIDTEYYNNTHPLVLPPDENTYNNSLDVSPSSMSYCPSMSPAPFLQNVEGVRYHPFQCCNNNNNINNSNPNINNTNNNYDNCNNYNTYDGHSFCHDQFDNYGNSFQLL